MSHFTVLVIGDDVEGQLAPYDEEIQVDPYETPCWCDNGKRKSNGETCDECHDMGYIRLE